MSNNIREVPPDFLETLDKLKQDNKASFRNIKKIYKTSGRTINRWFDILSIDLNQEKDDLNLDELKKDIVSGEYYQKSILKKYNISYKAVNKICKENNIIPNYKKYARDGFIPKDKNEFMEFLFINGKAKTARKYNITIGIINNYIKKENIEIESYKGIKIEIPKDFEDFVKNNPIYTINLLSKKYNVSRSVIKRWSDLCNISLTNKMDIWKSKRKSVIDNIEKYIELNNSMDLYKIAEQENISYEVLKTTFNQLNIPVILHTYNKSKGELEVKDFVISLGFEASSIKPLFNNKRFEIDIFIKELNFGIEYCGEYFHSHQNLQNKNYHKEKYEWCKQQNISLLTIFEHEWIFKNDIVKSMIKSRLGKADRIHARSTKFNIISNIEAQTFHDKNHINGGMYKSSRNYGLYYNNELVSVLSFVKSRFDKTYDYEISRFSSKLNTTIVGGFSKLMKNAISDLDSKSIVTYADLRFGEGNVYKSFGFEQLKSTVPNYWYFHKNIPELGFINRMNFQKKKIIGMGWGNQNQTEEEIMNERGYYKIYDCGNNKYGINLNY